MNEPLAVDLDGVLFKVFWGNVEEGMPFDSMEFGEVMPGAREGMKALKDAGFYLIIYTCRTNPGFPRKEKHSVMELQNIIELKLKEEGIPYDEVFVGISKPVAVAYIDDRAIEFKSWDDTLYKLGVK